MLALTVWQPWASLIVGAPPSYDELPTPPQKRIENRSWLPPRALIGQRIAIHAAKKMDEDVLDAIHDVFLDKLYGEVRVPYWKPSAFPVGAIVGVTTLAGAVVAWRDRIVDAFRGPGGPDIDIGEDGRRFFNRKEFGWLLADRRALAEPVPFRGDRKLWTLPGDIAARVEEQLR
jgi:hypothetical protein